MHKEKSCMQSLLAVTNRFYRNMSPTAWLLMAGFAIAMTTMIVGVGLLQESLAEIQKVANELDIPLLQTMQDTGFTLMVCLYFYSIINCMVVANFWIISKRRDLAIRKAFGWSVPGLIGFIAGELLKILFCSMMISVFLIVLLRTSMPEYFAFQVTISILAGTVVILLLTLGLSLIVPVIRIIQIKPKEVVE